jgi:hypothetical protein
MQTTPPAAPVSVPGFTDHHAHQLRDAAGVAFPPSAEAVAQFHRQVAATGRSPMDVLDAGHGLDRPGLDERLRVALGRAASAGLAEITAGSFRAPAPSAGTSPIPPGAGCCSPTPQRWPAGSRR